MAKSNQLVDQVFYHDPDAKLPATATVEDRRVAALRIAFTYGGIEEAHHKAWVIDQMIRTLAGGDYSVFVERMCDGEDGPNTYGWDTGIAP